METTDINKKLQYYKRKDKLTLGEQLDYNNLVELKMEKTKTALIYVYAHLPEKVRFLACPPEDITDNKYDDEKYLLRVAEMISELEEKDFDTRSDGVLPYSKEVIINHIKNRIEVLK